MSENFNYQAPENNPYDLPGILQSLQRQKLKVSSDKTVTQRVFGETLDREEKEPKVEKGWFAGVVNLLYLLQKEANIDDDLKKEIQDWEMHVTSPYFQRQTSVTEADINRSNRLLEKVLSATITPKSQATTK